MPGRNAIKGKQLYKILFFGVIFTVVAVAVLAFWGVREIRRDAAVVAVENSARGLAGAVTVLVNAVTKANEEVRMKTLASLKPSELRATFGKALKDHPVLIAVLVSDAKGVRYSLAHRKDGLVEGVTGRDGDSTIAWTLFKENGTSQKTRLQEHYDRNAINAGFAEEFKKLEPGQVSWRSIYAMFSSGESWLTASTLVEEGGENFMVSFVFPVAAVISQLGGAEKGSAEKIFLYWPTGKVIPVADLETVDGREKAPFKAQPADEVDDPVIARATERLASAGEPLSAPFSYIVDDETWWAYVMPLSVFGDTMSLGVAVPRKNIVSTLTSDTFLQVFGGILVLFAGVALFVVHKNRARIESIGLRQKAARTAEDVLRLIADGESRTLEFKQTLRFNLKSGKNGKEIEHASMKTVAGFMNSEGGTLLVGVADNGAVTGFEEDKLGNDDKALLHFNNLVNQQIGTEFARYLDTAVIEVQGKHVLRAYCMPAAGPAILKNGNNEEFYVRSGPASRQLTLSQFYEWLQNH